MMTVRLATLAALLTISLAPRSMSQTNSQAAGKQRVSIPVPFVGCASDGQVGAVPAPTEPDRVVRVDPAIAPMLAYYKPATAPGVLAPRGWFCFGVYGSSGSSVFVTPEPIDEAGIFKKKFGGEVVELQNIDGGTSGRFAVASVVARVFPAHKAFVQSVVEMFDFFEAELTFSPYPTDKLVYRSDRAVEYTTAADSDGLGSLNALQVNKDPIVGVAALGDGNPPNLLMLSMRLPALLKPAEARIIREVESGALTPQAR